MKKLFLLLLCAAGVVSAAYGAGKSTRSGKSAGALNGYFSISETKQVRFSQGNLQYIQSADTWLFAEHQYDFIGTDNMIGGTVVSDSVNGDYKEDCDALADRIDLFCWSGSTSTSSAKWGVSTSDDSDDYSGDLIDWGQNAISNGGNRANMWRTLTYAEWHYLLNARLDAGSKRGIASVNGVNGLVLLPDDWREPDGVRFMSGLLLFEDSSVDAYGARQSFTLAEWQLLENAGAVFLPAAGRRRGKGVGCVNLAGFYFSATPHDLTLQWALVFMSGQFFFGHGARDGLSVRLVQDVK